MNLYVKIKTYPNSTQKERLNRLFRFSSFIYNYTLSYLKKKDVKNYNAIHFFNIISISPITKLKKKLSILIPINWQKAIIKKTIVDFKKDPLNTKIFNLKIIKMFYIFLSKIITK